MPYNFEPIPPSDEINGSTALPLTRVKRIVKLDEEIGTCSSSATFLVTVAAEMFIQYLAKQGYKGAQKDRRKNLQYRDLANAVAALDTLEFLSDTIPRTVPYKKIATERIKKAAGELSAGQMTINGGRLERGEAGMGGETINEESEEEEEEEGLRGDGVDGEGEEGEEQDEEDVSRDVSMDVEEIRGYNGYGSGKRKLCEDQEDADMS